VKRRVFVRLLRGESRLRVRFGTSMPVRLVVAFYQLLAEFVPSFIRAALIETVECKTVSTLVSMVPIPIPPMIGTLPSQFCQRDLV
jgi:hypothetical protein